MYNKYALLYTSCQCLYTNFIKTDARHGTRDTGLAARDGEDGHKSNKSTMDNKCFDIANIPCVTPVYNISSKYSYFCLRPMKQNQSAALILVHGILFC